jgi:hypothetical protein
MNENLVGEDVFMCYPLLTYTNSAIPFLLFRLIMMAAVTKCLADTLRCNIFQFAAENIKDESENALKFLMVYLDLVISTINKNITKMETILSIFR